MTRRIVGTCLFVAGLWIGRGPVWGWALVLGGWALALIWCPGLRGRRTFALLALALALGVTRNDLDHRWESRGVRSMKGRPTVSGLILEPPRRWGETAVFLFEVQRQGGTPVKRPFRLLVRWSGCTQKLEPGERWEFQGWLRAPEGALYPGGFSQKFWLWTQRCQGCLLVGEASIVAFLSPPRGHGPYALAYRARSWMLRRLQAIDDPSARALVAGVVFGETQSLPAELQQQFRRTGTSHLLAASGMNVALLCGLVLGAARLAGWGPWRAAPLAVPAIVAYTFLAGCAPSIVRAAVGTLAALLALRLGRTSNAWNTLTLSVWVLLLWEPRQLYDLGFQLSVAAVIGLIGGPRLENGSAWSRSALMTVSATLLTLPITVWNFQELSLTLLPANLILGPLVEALFPLGTLLALWPCRPLAWLCEWLAKLCLVLVAWLSEVGDPMLLGTVGLFGGLLLGLAIAVWLNPALGPKRYLAVVLAVLSLAGRAWICSQPAVEPGWLRVRQVGGVYWVTLHQGEWLFLSESWQESRARGMMRSMGCLRPPRVGLLSSDKTLDCRWGEFDWRQVRPYLPETPYLEVLTDGRTCRIKTWSDDES